MQGRGGLIEGRRRGRVVRRRWACDAWGAARAAAHRRE